MIGGMAKSLYNSGEVCGNGNDQREQLTWAGKGFENNY